MRINVAVPEAHVTAPVLDAALESVTRLNEAMIERGEVPTFQTGLHHGVRWQPEPPGAEHFDHAGVVLGRKWGDCDDLAPWHAASLRHTGEDVDAKAVAQRSGPKRWHAVVMRGDGTIDDPSKRAGMSSHKGILGGVLPLMYAPTQAVVGGAYIIRPQIAMRPVRGAWQARADLPWYWREHLDDKPKPSDYAMTALHTAPVAASALTGAIDGVIDLGECAGFTTDEDVHKLSAVADAAQGMSLRDLRSIYGDEYGEAAHAVVGSFFSSLKRLASPIVNVATTAARSALPFVPGVGPIAAKALEFIPGLPGGGGNAPGTAAVAPGGAPGGRGYTCTYF